MPVIFKNTPNDLRKLYSRRYTVGGSVLVNNQTGESIHAVSFRQLVTCPVKKHGFELGKAAHDVTPEVKGLELSQALNSGNVKEVNKKEKEVKKADEKVKKPRKTTIKDKTADQILGTPVNEQNLPGPDDHKLVYQKGDKEPKEKKKVGIGRVRVSKLLNDATRKEGEKELKQMKKGGAMSGYGTGGSGGALSGYGLAPL
jgi:hypothetical protein